MEFEGGEGEWVFMGSGNMCEGIYENLPLIRSKKRKKYGFRREEALLQARM